VLASRSKPVQVHRWAHSNRPHRLLRLAKPLLRRKPSRRPPKVLETVSSFLPFVLLKLKTKRPIRQTWVSPEPVRHHCCPNENSTITPDQPNNPSGKVFQSLHTLERESTKSEAKSSQFEKYTRKCAFS
jgi:hypothetical protein